MAKYHLNPEKGPLLCRAKSGKCPYGEDAPHFSSREEAQEAYEKVLEKDFATPVHSKPRALDLELESALLERPEGVIVDELVDFADTSVFHFRALDQAVADRSARAHLIGLELELLSPYRRDNEDAVDRDTFREMKRKYDSYRDQTAAMVEALHESSHYAPKTLEHSSTLPVGAARPIAAHVPNTVEWINARFDSVGGSDVGTLAVMDFTPKEDLKFWDLRSLAQSEESKTIVPTAESVAKSNWSSRGSKAGALYRGTVWEDRNRDAFAESHPDLDVYSAAGQYAHPDRPWQQVNFDGLLAPKGQEINGILELKTGGDSESWKNGPPLSYRAQVLYYLDASELDYAIIAVSLHDGPLRQYRINRNDPVAPGVYDKPMSTYRSTRVIEWFEGLRASRTAQ